MLRSTFLTLGVGLIAARAADQLWPATVIEEAGKPPVVKTYATVVGVGAGALVAGLLALSRCRR